MTAPLIIESVLSLTGHVSIMTVFIVSLCVSYIAAGFVQVLISIAC